jgi:SAM-dependent methyltransferase
LSHRQRDSIVRGDKSPGGDRVIDRFWHAVGRQLRHPSGAAGALIGWLMAVVNDTPNRLAIEALTLSSHDHVLEMGFGPGRAAATMARRVLCGRVEGVDQSARMLQQATRRNRAAIASGRMVLVRGPFHPLPWSECTFDKILLANVAYFLDQEGRDIAEAYRVLRPAGRVVVYVTAQETMRCWPFSGPDSHRTFDADDLRALLKQAGFEQSAISIREVKLSLGIAGLLATAIKLDRSYLSAVSQSLGRGWRA